MNHTILNSIAYVALLTGCGTTATTAAGAQAGSSMVAMDYAARISNHNCRNWPKAGRKELVQHGGNGGGLVIVRSADNHDAVKQVPETLPRAPGNHDMREWTEDCTCGAKTFSLFELGVPITEIGAAGLIALRIGHDIDWDGPAMKVPGLPAADSLIKPQARVF